MTSIQIQDNKKQKARFGSKHTIDETIKKIEAAAKDVSLSVERKNSKVQSIYVTDIWPFPRSCCKTNKPLEHIR